MLIARDDPAVIDAKTRYSSRIVIFFHTPPTFAAAVILIVLSRLDKRHGIRDRDVALEKGAGCYTQL